MRRSSCLAAWRPRSRTSTFVATAAPTRSRLVQRHAQAAAFARIKCQTEGRRRPAHQAAACGRGKRQWKWGGGGAETGKAPSRRRAQERQGQQGIVEHAGASKCKSASRSVSPSRARRPLATVALRKSRTPWRGCGHPAHATFPAEGVHPGRTGRRERRYEKIAAQRKCGACNVALPRPKPPWRKEAASGREEGFSAQSKALSQGVEDGRIMCDGKLLREPGSKRTQACGAAVRNSNSQET